MIRYGLKDCNHMWRYRKDGWKEQCVPMICIECGAFGCQCDMDKNNIVPKNIFFNEGLNSNANINGNWINPYVKEK